MTRFYFRDTTTEPGTVSPFYDLSETQGTSATVSHSAGNTNEDTLVMSFRKQMAGPITSTSFPVSVDVTELTADTVFRVELARLNSSGTLIASSALSVENNSTGVQPETISFSQSWNTGDILELRLYHRRTGGHGGNTFTVGVNRSTSYIDATLAQPQTVNAVAGTASAAAQIPTVTAEVSTFGATVNAVTGTASAAMLEPTPSTDVAVTATTGTASAAAGIPTVAATTDATVNAEAATASAAANTPTLQTGVQITAVAGTSSAAAETPTVSLTNPVNITLESVPGTSSAQAHIPVVTAELFLSTTAEPPTAEATATAPIPLPRTFVPGSGGAMSVWNGSTWVSAPINVWNGASWVSATPYVWNGTAWV